MKNSKALLLFHHPASNNAPTIMDHVSSFGKYSNNSFTNINTIYGFPKTLGNYQFDIIVLHYSLFGSHPFSLFKPFYEYVRRQSSCIKIAFFQDEYQYCLSRFKLINELDISVIFSLLEEKYLKPVYNRCECVKHIYSTLAGYVSEDLKIQSNILFKHFNERTVDFGYRARDLSFVMGKGAQEKTDIAFKFQHLCKGKGYKLDLSSSENTRIYGDDWFRFISNCKAMLGVEAGVSIFDVNGDAAKECQNYLKLNPQCSFAEISNDILYKYEKSEDNFYYRMISPRIFESAAFKVCMILFEGKYTQILEPLIHYIPLKKDFSNIDEVLSIYNNDQKRNTIIQNAYDHLIESNHFSFSKFIFDFDEIIDSFNFQKQPDQDLETLRLDITKIKKIFDRRHNFKQLIKKTFI